jgi:tRNA (guanine-N1)-methyltransferase
VDDYPYGGGSGMVMAAPPIYDAFMSIVQRVGYKPRLIYMSPQEGFQSENSNGAEGIPACGFVVRHYEGLTKE